MNLPENSTSAVQQEILDALPVLVFLERAGQIVFANAEARRMLGMAGDAWVQRPVEDILWGLFPGTAEPHTPLSGGSQGSPFHASLAGKGGLPVTIEGTYSMVNAELREAVIIAQAGGRDRAPGSRLMEDVLASIPEAVVLVHGSHVLYTNPAFTRMFGFTAEDVAGANLRDFIVPETRQHENALLQRAIEEHGQASIETVRVTKDGELVDVDMHIAPLMVGGGKAGYVLTYRDIGDRKQVEARLQHDAMHDVLTGLPNRALFLDRLDLALSRRLRRRDQGCGVLFLDLDRFKSVNDTLGHAAGDMLLISVAGRLRSALRPQDTAARLGGDEFAVLVENIITVADLGTVAARVLKELERPFDVLGNSLEMVASIGMSMAGNDDTTPETLIREADFAMYRAKQRGGHRCDVFDKCIDAQPSPDREQERELRRVLDKREFELWYQPIYRLTTGRVEGFEALLRWHKADGTIDSFRDLLSVAEETGLSISIGRDTIDTACLQLESWAQSMPGNDLTLSLNVTHRQFYHDDLVAHLRKKLVGSRIDPSRIMFEVSESVVNHDPDGALAILQRLVDCGVRIALDNFGSSLGPLNHLLRLPIEVVKMDPALTEASVRAGRQLALVESLIHLGKAVGVQVLAQGIETKEQWDGLRNLGCELGQGHFLSHALEATRAQQLVSNGSWALQADV